jgi:hypothetical protein
VLLNIEMPSTPLTISSQSRKKLKAFSFDGRTDILDQNKENEVPSRTNVGKEQSKKHVSQHDDRHTDPVLPQTPAAKIPLADLISNTEDAFNCAPLLATPNDHVLWQHGPRSSDPSTSFHSSQRDKKRARSSSPISSQLERSDYFPAKKDPLDLESMPKLLRTPQNDPTMDLWNRYTNGNATKSAKGDFTASVFANLMPSSPQTPSTTNSKDGGLRRTASCGLEWPTSKSKRQRVDNGESYGRTRDVFAASKRDILATDLPKTSRVSLLVEKIQESLARKPVAEIDGPSSSSPLPERNGKMVEPTSPIPQRVQPMQTIIEDKDPTADLTNIFVNNAISAHHDNSSSEFGDDDIDFNFLESVEQEATQRMQQEAGPGAATGNLAFDGETTRNSIDQQQRGHFHSRSSARSSQPETKSQCPERRDILQQGMSDDEFDEDDATFTNELLDLAAQYDTQGNIPVTASAMFSNTIPQSNEAPIVCEQVKDGEFDDGFDDDDDDEIWKDMDENTVMQQESIVGSASQVCTGCWETCKSD